MGNLRKADIGVALYLLSAFIMLIVPIPSWLLDVLLACNISVAFTVMFGCMFANEVLKMSYFPEKKFLIRMDFRLLGKLASENPFNFSPFSTFKLLQFPAIPCKIQLSTKRRPTT